MKKRLVALGIVAGLTLGFAGPALAGPPPPPKDTKGCNSGNGNGDEIKSDGTECDPGNSGAKNNGKDGVGIN